MHEIKMPQMGQSVEEAEIVEWFKHEGDAVKEGEPIFSIQTDKAEIECESTASGVVRKILVEPGVEVPVMTVVALVGEVDEALPDLEQYAVAAKPAEAPPAPEAAAVAAPAPAPAVPAPAAAPLPSPTPADGESFISPRARRLADELDIDPTFAVGTGPGGRIIEEDVQAYGERVKAIKITPVAKKLARQKRVDITMLQGSGPGGRITKEDVEKAPAATPAPARPAKPAGLVPLSPMRRIIAQRMVESKTSAPHYYITVEVDMARARDFRKHNEGFRPSFNELVLFATAQALKAYPAVNARWHGDAIEELASINLGFAVALPQGLIVPVIKNMERMTLQQTHEETRRLIDKTKSGKLTPDDYTGNTFTVSNLGSFGVDHFTAIINQPDSAILAVGQIKDRVVVVDGGIHIRPIMKLTLSSDHRVIDGALAAQFMGHLKTILEKAAF